MLCQKILGAVLLFAEALGFCFFPKVLDGLRRYRGKWFNVQNLNNATSGALLSLSVIHLLPEGFDGKNLINICNVDLRGCIIVAPILLLTTLDFLVGHHCGDQVQLDTNVQTLNVTSIHTGDGKFDNEDVESEFGISGSKNVVPMSLPSTMSDVAEAHTALRMEALKLKIIQFCTSKSMYLLLIFFTHSILEGAILGNAESSPKFWSMLFGILAHKWTESIILTRTAMDFIKPCLYRNLCYILFSLCIPIGMLISHYSRSKINEISPIFQLTAVGFFLYLSFELLTGHNGEIVENRTILLESYIIGAVVMAVILGIASFMENDH